LAKKRSLQRQLNRGLIALASVLMVPLPSAWAANMAPGITGRDSSNETQEKIAKSYEAQGEWALACTIYENLLVADRNQPEIKKKFLHSLRQCQRVYRQNKPGFMEQIVSPQYKMGESIEFFKDVVVKVQAFYLDSEKVHVARLFQEGIEELLMDLEDLRFRGRFLKQNATAEEINDYVAYLRQKSADARPGSVNEAVEQLRIIAREGLRKLQLNSKVTFIEFACGACNALDEYSFYLSQGDLLSASPIKSVPDAGLLEKGIGYIKIASFDDTTVATLDAVLGGLKENKMDVLILDLRDNSGGSVDVAIQVVERFLATPRTIASTSGRVSKTFQSTSMTVVEAPIFVLIDNDTASAAELVAGALKAHKRADLIGQTTYGKNLVQKMVPISQAPFGALRVSWSQFHLPKNDEVSKTGVSPTIPTSAGEELNTALDRARPLIAMMMR
jgi:hypothetical protein